MNKKTKTKTYIVSSCAAQTKSLQLKPYLVKRGDQTVLVSPINSLLTSFKTSVICKAQGKDESIRGWFFCTSSIPPTRL